jgi:hypothetical protein
MSLLRSIQPPTTAEALAALRAAIEDVSERSLCAYTEPCERSRFLEAWSATVPSAIDHSPGVADPHPLASPEPAEVWYSTAVQFHGPFSGEVSVILPRSLTLELYRSFAGMTFDENPSEAEIRDFAAEFANVVCGHWLTRTYTHLKFDLTAPVVDALVAATEAPPLSASALAAELYLCINDVPLQLTFAPRAMRAAG